MDYTIINGSGEKMILAFYSIPFNYNSKRKIKNYDILPYNFCKVGFSSKEDTLFKVMGPSFSIEFEVLSSDKKIHVTHESNISYYIDPEENRIFLQNKNHQ